MTTKAENDQTEILHNALDRAANSDNTYAAAEGSIKRATEAKELAPMAPLDKSEKEVQQLELNPTRPAISDTAVPTRLEQLQASATGNQELKDAISQLATLFDNSLLKSIINTPLEKKLNDYFNSASARGRQNALEEIKNEALNSGSPESIAIMKASLTFDAGMRLLESKKSTDKSRNVDEKLALTDLATLAHNNTPAARALLEKYASNAQTDTAVKDSQSDQIRNNQAAVTLIKAFAESAGNSEQPKLTQLKGQIAAIGRDAFVSGNTPLKEAAAWVNLAAPIATRLNAGGAASDADLAQSLSELQKLAKSGNRQAAAIVDGILKDAKSAGLRDLLADSESLAKALSSDPEKGNVLKQALKPVLEQLAQVKNGNEQEIAAMFGLSIPADKAAKTQKGERAEKDTKIEKNNSTNEWKEIKDQKGTRFEKHTADGGSMTKNEKGQLTELKNANGESRTFEYNTDGSAKAMREPSGRQWQSEDGEHWKSENPRESRVFQFQITEDGRYFERNEAGAIKALAIDGSSITTDAQGRIIETVSKNNQRRAYEYDAYSRSPSAILEGPKGKEQVWTRNELKIIDETKSAGAAEWTSPGKEPFKGTKQVHSDGSLESIDLKGNRRVEILDGRTLERNAEGKPTFVKEPNGKEHTLNYKDGKLIGETLKEADGSTKEFNEKQHLLEIKYPDGTHIKYDETGLVTETLDKVGKLRQFKYDKDEKGNERLSWAKTESGEWQLGKDPNTWTNIADKSTFNGALLVKPDGDFLSYSAEKKDISIKHLDSSSELHNKEGGALRFDASGKAVEMVTPLGEHRKFEYFQKGSAHAGQLSAVTGADGVRWTTTDSLHWTNESGAEWTGKISFRDGVYREIDKDGNEKARGARGLRENLDRRALEKDMEAIEYAMHGGLGIGIDTKTVNNILENRSESERRMITRLWNETHSVEYGFGLREAFADKMNGSALQKTLNLLDKPDNKLDFAGEIRFSLLDRGQWFGERKNAVDEKAIRETLAKMTAADIRAADASYKQRFDGDGMASEIMSDSHLSLATKEAAMIYLKGADKRTDEDTLHLAQIAMKAADVEMFGEAWAGASQDARDRFIAQGGQEQMQKAFGGSYWNILTLGLTGNITDKDLRRTIDYQAFGKLSVATETRENTTWLGDNITAIEKSLADMTDKERALYERGRTLTHYDLQDAKEGDGEARAYYKKTHAALESAAGWWFSPASSVAQLAKWEDMARTKGGGVISRVAENRGYVWNSSTESLMSSIENMSKDDIRRLKTDPAFRKDLDNTIDTMWGLVTGQSIAEVKRAHDLVKRKAEAEADTQSYSEEQRKMYYEGRELVVSGHNMEHASKEDLKAVDFYLSKVTESANANQRRDVMSALNDNVSWYHNNEDKVYEALTNMTRSEIANYKNNTDGFRDKLDEHLKSVLSSGAYKVASTMLESALRGEQPKTDVLQKLEYRASCWTSDNGKVVRDLLSAFHEDPKLQERIAHPKTAEDKALSEHFHDAAKRAMGSRVYGEIGEKLLDTGKIDLGAQLELSFGHIYPYQTLYTDAAAASAEDRAALLKSTNNMTTAFMILGEDERQILTNVLKQGEVRPEDKLRGYVTGLGASKAEIQQLFSELKDRDKMKDELSKRPELKGKTISDDMISNAINARLNDVRTAYAHKYNESLNERLSYELGGDAWVNTRRLSQNEALTGSEILQRAQNEHYDTKCTMSGIMNWVGWDGTSGMADSRNLQAQDLQIKYAASGQEIPMDDARKLAENILTAVDNRAKSESSLIDAGVDAAITAATIALLLPSGGSSLSMMALTRFPMLARGIATVAEVTKGLAQAARVEALATYLQSASRITQLTVAGLAGGSTKLGAHVALNSRFDIASEGATKFTEGFVSTVGQLVGAKDVAALQGLFRESGEKAAAKLSAEFLEQGGKAIVNAEAKQQAIHGMTDIIRTSLAAGTDNIDKKLVTDLAEQMVKSDLKGILREQAVAQITKEITAQIEKQLLTDCKQLLAGAVQETVLNMQGGALGGLSSGLVHWNPDLTIDQNLQQVMVSTASGAGMSGVFTVGMKGVGHAFDYASTKVGKLLKIAPSEIKDAANPQLLNVKKDYQLPQIIGEGKAGANGSTIFRHMDGELVHHADGSLTISKNKTGETLNLTPDGQLASHEYLRNGSKIKDEFTYEADGKLKFIKSSDGSVTKQNDFGSWQRETIGAGGKINKESLLHMGDISVAPDGRLMLEPGMGRGEIRIISNIDYVIETISEKGRSTFTHVELPAQKARLEQMVDSRFTEAGRSDRFRSLMTDFEIQAKARNLPESEIAEVYLHVNRMLADDAVSPLTLAERANLAEQALNHAAYPTSIDQGANSTCNVATMEHMLYAHSPSKIVQLVADVSLTGKYVTADGVTVDLSQVRNGFVPDAQAKASIRLQTDGTQKLIKEDGPRDHASQIAETALVNAHYAKASVLLKDNKIVSDYELSYDYSGNVFHNSKSAATEPLYDAAGKDVSRNWMDFSATYYDKKGNAIDPKLIEFGEVNGRVYVKGKLSLEDRVPLFDEQGNALRNHEVRPGQIIKDQEGETYFYKTNPGEIVYDKPSALTPFDKGEQLRVNETANSRAKHLINSDGTATDSPGLQNSEIADLYKSVTGEKPTQPIFIELGTTYSDKAGDTIASVANELDLHRVLSDMESNHRFPVIMAVYAHQAPFQAAPSNMELGGTGGYHVINIQGYDPNTGMVKFTNQWGSQHDHVADGGVSLNSIFKGMQKPKANAPVIKTTP